MDPSFPGLIYVMAVTSAAVRDHLKGVLQIQASKHAFAAILEDESVVTCVGNKFTDEAKLRTRST